MDKIALNLRLPKELHSILVKLAKQENRSLNKQIVHILGEYIAKQDKDEINKPTKQ